MKKMCLFALAFATSTAVFAQHAQPQLRAPRMNKVAFGLDAGVNLARLDANAGDFSAGMEPSTNSKTAFHVAAFVNVPLGGMVSLKPQVMYSKQGGKLAMQGKNFERDLDYIYVAPASLHLMTKGGFVVETGPMLGFLLSASEEDITAGGTTTDIKNRMKTTDFMWSGGIGYMSPVGLGVHARYNHGFSNVLNADNDMNQQAGKLQNRVIQIGLMYQFGGH